MNILLYIYIPFVIMFILIIVLFFLIYKNKKTINILQTIDYKHESIKIIHDKPIELPKEAIDVKHTEKVKKIME